MIQTILLNGNFITLDAAMPRASAVAISYGRLAAVGDNAEIARLAGRGTSIINLDGKTALPGLSDAHLHWQAQAQSMRSVDVFELPSKADALERVRQRAQQTPPGEWVTGQGWAQELWAERAFPSRADLDAVAPQNPVYLSAKSGHAAWVNSRALSLAGVADSTPDPDGGEILRDKNGAATGILLETAMDLVSERVPTPSPEELADMMQAAQTHALQRGLTMIHDFDDPSCLVALQILRERGDLCLRVVKQINQQWLEAALASGIRRNFGDDWIRIGALKLFADGALGPKTALMFEVYAGEDWNTGMAVVDKETMVDYVCRASAAGLPSSIHAIGDKAVHDVLDVFEIARGQEAARGEARSSRRHRIEHVQIIHPQDSHRLAALGVIASMQPIHATSDMVMADRYWGERAKWAYNPRLQLDYGARVAFGSDAPVEPLDPLLGIHAAVTRQRHGEPAGGWHPEARISLQEALLGYTQGPAYAAEMEDRLGMLRAGYLADLVLLDRDITLAPAEEIPALQILGTMVDGEWRYRNFD
ncbi:MAG: amidohydrolase [Chloroflexi bacterium]|nr:amidohydrolase [Chloroflexota bacterium]MCY3581723.1 amidohydrolase [Chloroflexota bacterium]MCY3716303.1 amidohydrolase [Chloroflexota bacterium]MDE2651328.1 amidohydrolase [Chloroflexota bacterium]MXV92964.1 amidohydrolase [Chloroflexota bacterium]